VARVAPADSIEHSDIMNNTLLRRLAIVAALLAFCVIVFGAFVRLSNAGLSCPDWPTCYGKITWPGADHEIAHANANFERAVETHKAWREQIHRHLAALLGVLVLAIALIAARQRRGAWLRIGAAATLVAVSIPLYIKQHYGAAIACAGLGEIILLWSAWRWRGSDHARMGSVILMVIIFQALLGMWTVTWLLKPIVVMSHLVGGLTTLALLSWLSLRLCGVGATTHEDLPRRSLIIVGLALLAMQIALGGWTSANYAAWSCGTDFPTCLGQWWPLADYREGFVLWRGIGVDYEGGVLDGPARTAIQMAHRIFALLVSGHLLMLGVRLVRTRVLRTPGMLLLAALGAQVLIGIANVKFGLPLHVAVAHNAGAALLLLVMVWLLARTTPRAGT
jgi:heme a synthase